MNDHEAQQEARIASLEADVASIKGIIETMTNLFGAQQQLNKAIGDRLEAEGK
jgi:uncharacterized coiled-coil protein SlyX